MTKGRLFTASKAVRSVPEAASARGKLVERWKSLQADLAGAQARQPQAETLTAMQRGIFGAELGHRAADFGLTEADKLLNQRAELTKDIARTEEQLDDFGHGMTPMRIPTQEKWLPAWSPGRGHDGGALESARHFI